MGFLGKYMATLGFAAGALLSMPTAAFATDWRADALVAVDQNRSAIVADIVAGFRGDLALAFPGGEVDEAARLSAQLAGLRADRLLAASLASSYGSLKAILRDAQVEQARQSVRGRAKALGDANRDLVYTPLTPCRLVDTRGFGAPIQGGSFSANARRNYIPQGGCGLPTTNVSAILISFTTQNLSPNSGGYLAILAPGAPVSASVDVFNLGAEWSASNTVVKTGTAAEFDVFVAVANAHVVIDILGYFSPPQGGVVTSITAGAGLTGGTITSSGTIGLAATQLLPTSPCTNGQVAKWSGTAWACANDTDTNTTYTPGTGLTLAGTQFQIAPAFQLPQACPLGQLPSSNGAGGWTCALPPPPAPTFGTWVGFVSAIAPSSSYVFAGGFATVSVAGPASHLTAVGNVKLGATNNVTAKLDICFQPAAGGAISSLTSGGFFSISVNNFFPFSYGVAGSRTALAAGNYNVGVCVTDASGTIDLNDRAVGWAMVTN